MLPLSRRKVETRQGHAYKISISMDGRGTVLFLGVRELLRNFLLYTWVGVAQQDWFWALGNCLEISYSMDGRDGLGMQGSAVLEIRMTLCVVFYFTVANRVFGAPRQKRHEYDERQSLA